VKLVPKFQILVSYRAYWLVILVAVAGIEEILSSVCYIGTGMNACANC
jgi:hypothetical protein